jgi:lipopolysaccharide export system ATP-binding protein
MNTLSVINLDQTIGKKQILKSISINAQSGSITALLGPNGAGKTTLLKTIMGFYHTLTHQEYPPSNNIILNDTIINNYSIYKRVEEGLTYLPQHTSLLQQLSVQDNLSLVFEYQPYWKTSTYQNFIDERNQWLTYTNLSGTLTQKAHSLSGGQKRKLEIVRTLLMHPKIIMLDEPFAGVDPKSIYELKKIFTDVITSNIAIIISDHHVDQLLSIAHYVYVVINGNIITQGTSTDILEHTATKEMYLGSQFYHEMTQRFHQK